MRKTILLIATLIIQFSIINIRLYAQAGSDGTLDLSLGNAVGGCDQTNQPTIFSWNGSTCTINTNTKNTFYFTTINIPVGDIVTATSSTSLTFNATGDVTIGGLIDLSGGNGTSAGIGGIGGAGGWNGGAEATPGGGTGKGARGVYDGTGTGGGGGGHGNLGGDGGEGGNGTQPAGIGGASYNVVNSGGSGGGGGGQGNASTGAGGGGALEINSDSNITTTGNINANGGNGGTGGNPHGGGGGGGAGGRIMLIAAQIINNGSITAFGGIGGNPGSGGSGGAGGGGAGGRILLQDCDGNIDGSGTISFAGGIAGTGYNGPSPATDGGVGVKDTISNITAVNLGNDTNLACGSQIILDANSGYDSYSWQDNSTNQTYTVTDSGMYYVTVSLSACTATDSVYITRPICVGINQHSSSIVDDQFSVYPNPNDGQFTIECQITDGKCQKANVLIYDLLGKVVYKTSITNQSKIINIKDNINKGIYYLQLITEEGTLSERIIVQ